MRSRKETLSYQTNVIWMLVSCTVAVLLGFSNVYNNLHPSPEVLWLVAQGFGLVIFAAVAITWYTRYHVLRYFKQWRQEDELLVKVMRRNSGQAAALYLQGVLQIWEEEKSTQYHLEYSLVIPGLCGLAELVKLAAEATIESQQIRLSTGSSTLNQEAEESYYELVEKQSRQARDAFWAVFNRLARSGRSDLEWLNQLEGEKRSWKYFLAHEWHYKTNLPK